MFEWVCSSSWQLFECGNYRRCVSDWRDVFKWIVALFRLCQARAQLCAQALYMLMRRRSTLAAGSFALATAVILRQAARGVWSAERLRRGKRQVNTSNAEIEFHHANACVDCSCNKIVPWPTVSVWQLSCFMHVSIMVAVRIALSIAFPVPASDSASFIARKRSAVRAEIASRVKSSSRSRKECRGRRTCHNVHTRVGGRYIDACKGVQRCARPLLTTKACSGDM